MTWIKICGTTSLEDARLAVEAGADALGFVFAKSPRRVTPEQAREIIAKLPGDLEKVGVFVNESSRAVLDIARGAGLTTVQLHGDEDEAYIQELQAARKTSSLRVLTMLPATVLDRMSATQWLSLETQLDQPTVDAVLIDSGSPRLRGGTGQPFDWNKHGSLVSLLGQRLRIIIAGGLNAGNVTKAITLLRPWGVDVVSGVEREPGKKDPEKVRAFINAVRQADKEHSRL